MRLITDGDRFAGTKGRRFWTKLLDRVDDYWWFANGDYTYYCWFQTKEAAVNRMNTYTKQRKHWYVKE